MPRVHTKTKSTRGKEYTCTKCGNVIDPGTSYYEWSRRFGMSGTTYRQHQACGFPRPTQLSSRKTAVLEEAIQDTDFAVWQPELGDAEAEAGGSLTVDYVDLTEVLRTVADTAREVASEYEESFNNLPENFQYGSTGTAMEEVAQELNDWADDVESWEPDNYEIDVPDLPTRDEFPDDPEFTDAMADWSQQVQDAFDQLVDEMRSSAEDKLSDVPEYQG